MNPFLPLGNVLGIVIVVLSPSQAERELDVPSLGWPCKGVELRNVYARHRPDLPPVLHGVSLSVR